MSSKPIDLRLAALWRFALAITVLNVLGHTFFGFEQSLMQPMAALATAYSLEIGLEWIDARSRQRPRRFEWRLRSLAAFLLPAHITALAVSMLLYANDQLLPIIFATAVAIASKSIFRAPTPRGSRHFLNPSNIGISTVLLLFPWVGIAPPYHFTENLVGWGDWLLPALIVISGTLLNTIYTRKMPLILAWLGGFALQALVRSLIFATPLTAGLVPVTGMAFVLFTFYMVSDPGTTPFPPSAQVIFGLTVAATYSLLMMVHVVFGLFFALTLVCVGRGLGLTIQALAMRRSRKEIQDETAMQAPAVAGRV